LTSLSYCIGDLIYYNPALKLQFVLLLKFSFQLSCQKKTQNAKLHENQQKKRMKQRKKVKKNTKPGFVCSHCKRICKSECGLMLHKRSCKIKNLKSNSKPLKKKAVKKVSKLGNKSKKLSKKIKARGKKVVKKKSKVHNPKKKRSRIKSTKSINNSKKTHGPESADDEPQEKMSVWEFVPEEENPDAPVKVTIKTNTAPTSTPNDTNDSNRHRIRLTIKSDYLPKNMNQDVVIESGNLEIELPDPELFPIDNKIQEMDIDEEETEDETSEKSEKVQSSNTEDPTDEVEMKPIIIANSTALLKPTTEEELPLTPIHITSKSTESADVVMKPVLPQEQLPITNHQPNKPIPTHPMFSKAQDSEWPNLSSRVSRNPAINQPNSSGFPNSLERTVIPKSMERTVVPRSMGVRTPSPLLDDEIIENITQPTIESHANGKNIEIPHAVQHAQMAQQLMNAPPQQQAMFRLYQQNYMARRQMQMLNYLAYQQALVQHQMMSQRQMYQQQHQRMMQNNMMGQKQHGANQAHTMAAQNQMARMMQQNRMMQQSGNPLLQPAGNPLLQPAGNSLLQPTSTNVGGNSLLSRNQGSLLSNESTNLLSKDDSERTLGIKNSQNQIISSAPSLPLNNTSTSELGLSNDMKGLSSVDESVNFFT